jgi:cytochrome c553
MRICNFEAAAVTSLALAGLMAAAAASSHCNETGMPRAREGLPYWAFAVDPPAGTSNAAAGVVDAEPRHVPGSAAAFTPAQLSDLFSAPDWHPGKHPTMPEVVAHGHKPDVFACGYCHLPNGQGRPENSTLAGLPESYIVQQVADFKSGLRKSSEPRHVPTALMIGSETKAGPQEILAAARYFSSLRRTPWIRVVETDTVAKTHVAGWMLVASSDAGIEPIGSRIIETPENLERTELRDDTSGFVAYVPVGSIKRGESLVKAGDSGKTLPCGGCHGADLRGHDNVPSIAGRSPSYVVRQLYDIQHGARAGAAAGLMKLPVAKLSLADMVSIAAYAATLPP